MARLAILSLTIGVAVAAVQALAQRSDDRLVPGLVMLAPFITLASVGLRAHRGDSASQLASLASSGVVSLLPTALFLVSFWAVITASDRLLYAVPVSVAAWALSAAVLVHSRSALS